MKRMQKQEDAVTAIVATALLLGMTIALFSVLMLMVNFLPFNPAPPSVNLIGAIEADQVVIEHNGGEALPLDTIVIIIISDGTLSQSVDVWGFGDPDGNNLWNIGEKLTIDPDDYGELPEINSNHVAVTVVDVEINAIVMMGVLQESNG